MTHQHSCKIPQAISRNRFVPKSASTGCKNVGAPFAQPRTTSGLAMTARTKTNRLIKNMALRGTIK